MGLKTAREAVDFRSPLFRGDLLEVSTQQLNRQDRNIGFDAVLTTLFHPERSVRWNEKTQKKEYYNRPFLLPELIMTASRFNLIFPSFSDREAVRRLLGVNSTTFPFDASLITPEEYADLQKQWALLPKMRRKAFTLELSHKGAIIGSLLFAAYTRELELLPGESALTIDDHYAEPHNNYMNRGPLPSHTSHRFDSDKLREQDKAQRQQEDDQQSSLQHLRYSAEGRLYYEDLIRTGDPIKEGPHRENMLRIFNDQLLDVMNQISQEDQILAQLIQE